MTPLALHQPLQAPIQGIRHVDIFVVVERDVMRLTLLVWPFARAAYDAPRGLGSFVIAC
jgi:hypothetical protein